MIFLDELKKELSNKFGSQIYFIDKNNVNNLIHSIIEIDCNNITNNNLMWINNKNVDKIKLINFGTLILPKISEDKLNQNFNGTYILCDRPRYIFNYCIKLLKNKNENNFIDNKKYNFKNVKIGSGTIIEDNVKIGEGTIIGYNNVIHSETVIGNNCIIGSNNTIGGVGFGYEKNDNGIWEKIEHIGNVIIQNDVEIGNNNSIDRGVIKSTIIGNNSKIDNLVHIAHNVNIGSNCLIIANSMIAGSVKIGDNTWISPSSSIINGITIGRESTIGMGSVVIKKVDDNVVVAGVPARILKASN